MNARMPLGVTAVMLPELDFQEQIDLCRSLGVSHYVFRPRVIAERDRGQPYSNWGNHKFDLTPERLLEEGPRLRQQLEEAGITPLGTVPQVSADQPDEELTLHFRGAAAAGAPRVRVAPPAYPAQVFDYAQYLQKTREAYRRAVELARPHGVKIVIEMHCRTSATSPGLAYQIVQGFDPADLGVIPDLGNFSIEGAITPHLAVSVLRDWIDHCHIGGSRRVQSDYDEAGFRRTSHVMCPLAESELPIAAWLKALATLNRPIPLVIEDYTPNVPGRLRLTTSAQQAQRLLKCL